MISDILEKEIIFICYPNDWHWALSAEYVNSRIIKGAKIEVVDLSYIAEPEPKTLIRKMRGGSKLERDIRKYFKQKNITYLKYSNSYLRLWINMLSLKTFLQIIDEANGGLAYNTIVEKTGLLSIKVNEHKRIVNEEITKLNFTNLILNEMPSAEKNTIVTVNGRFTKNACVLSFAKRNNLRFKLLEFGSNRQKYEIFLNSPHSMFEVQAKIINYWESADRKTRIQIAESFINGIEHNYSFSPYNFRKRMIPSKIPKIDNRKILTFFGSTESEYAGVRDSVGENEFSNQYDAFRAIVALLDPVKWKIYLRLHPSITSDYSNGSDTEKWLSFQKKSNVEIILPNSDIDSIALGLKSDVAVVFASTIAMELLSLGQKKIISMGPAPWNKLLPDLYVSDNTKLEHFFNNMSDFQGNKTDIYPWAYYMSNFGNDFSILKFEETMHTWVMR